MNKQQLLNDVSFLNKCSLRCTDNCKEIYKLFLYWKFNGSDVNTKYNTKEELLEDITFIKSLQMNIMDQSKEILEVYNIWYETSPDSFNYERIQSETMDAANTLVKISKDTGRSNQWKGTHTEYVMVTPKRTYNLRPRNTKSVVFNS